MCCACASHRQLELLSLALGLVLLCTGGPLARAADEAVIIESSRHGDMVEIRASAELAADRDTAWRVLTDYARYTEFVPDLRESRISARNGPVVFVEQEGSAIVGPLRFPVSITYRIRESPPDALESHAVAGSLPSLESRYSLSARQRGSQLVYTGRVRPPFLLFGSVGQAAVEANVRRQFQSLVDEIERQHEKVRVPLSETAR